VGTSVENERKQHEKYIDNLNFNSQRNKSNKNKTMKSRIKLSKLLQIGLLLTFLLPFFPHGCEFKEAKGVSIPDSTKVATNTLKHESSKLTTSSEKSDTLKTAAIDNTIKTGMDKKEKDLSLIISEKSPLLKVILRPNDNYTGVANIIDCFSLLGLWYGLVISFLLWLIALIVKIKDFNNIFILLNFIGLLFLFGAQTTNFTSDGQRLWGFWVCAIWSATMILYDIFILLKIRKERLKTCA